LRITAWQGVPTAILTGEPLYPFGHGLSYTHFAYQNLSVTPVNIQGPQVLQVSCEVKNTGELPGDEVVQVYLRSTDAAITVPRHSLVGFKRVHLAAGAVARLDFALQPRSMPSSPKQGQWALNPGQLTIFVGGGQPGFAAPGLSANVQIDRARIFLRDFADEQLELESLKAI
jgi:beta-glucosidase